MGLGIGERERMAKRAAEEISAGMVVNLGIGIPSLVPNHLSPDLTVMFHAENGIIGMGGSPEKGREDENLCNAGGFPVSVIPGACYFDSSIAFGMIRKGRVDLTILGALQVSQKGDLANWIIPGKKIPGMGGAIELAEKAKKVMVLMNHQDKNGYPKLVDQCTIPLTGRTCVDVVITEMAVFRIRNGSFILSEVFAPYTALEIAEKTGFEFAMADPIRMIEY